MNPLFKTTFLVAALALAACAPQDPHVRTQSPPPKPKAVPTPPPKPELMTDRARVQNEYQSAKVDILFVIDNSNSMTAHRDRLVANMNRFAESFIKNTDVDFHIGVVKVYDSTRFAPGQPTYVPNGQLLSGFVKRGGDTVAELQEMLNVPVLGLEQGGPEIEEVFSPIRAAFSDEMLKGPNAGFYRPEAHLAVIMITDANDSSVNFDEGQLQAFLNGLKNQKSEKYSTYAVLANEAKGVRCKLDPSGAPHRINKLIEITKGQSFSLCDPNYGARLAKVGSAIAAKAVFNRVVELTWVPHPHEPIVVKCEGKEIPKGAAGWSFGPNPSAYTVVISDAYQGCKSQDAVIEVTYAKLDKDKMKTQ